MRRVASCFTELLQAINAFDAVFEEALEKALPLDEATVQLRETIRKLELAKDKIVIVASHRTVEATTALFQ